MSSGNKEKKTRTHDFDRLCPETKATLNIQLQCDRKNNTELKGGKKKKKFPQNYNLNLSIKWI